LTTAYCDTNGHQFPDAHDETARALDRAFDVRSSSSDSDAESASDVSEALSMGHSIDGSREAP